MWVKAVWEFKHSIRIFFLEDHRFAVRGASAAPGMEEESQRCRETTMSGGTKNVHPRRGSGGWKGAKPSV